MRGDTDRVRKVQRATVEDKLSQDSWRRMELENAAHWLHLSNCIHQLREEPVPHFCSGLAAHHDLLYGVIGGGAEVTGWA